MSQILKTHSTITSIQQIVVELKYVPGCTKAPMEMKNIRLLKKLSIAFDYEEAPIQIYQSYRNNKLLNVYEPLNTVGIIHKEFIP